jgi:hypothetical protein
MTEWSTREYEAYLESRGEKDEAEEGEQEGWMSPNRGEKGDDLTPLFTFSTLTSLLHLRSLSPDEASPSSPPSRAPTALTYLSPRLTLSRSSFLPPSPPLSSSPTLKRTATLYLIDALSRLVADSHAEEQVKRIGEKRGERKKVEEKRERREGDEREWREAFEERMRGLEKVVRLSETERGSGRGENDEVRRLRNEVRNLEVAVKRLSSPSFSRSLTRQAAVSSSDAGGTRWVDTGWEGKTAAFVAVFVLGLAVGVGVASTMSA